MMPSYRVVVAHRREFEEVWWDKLNDFHAVFLAEGDSWCSYGSLKFRNLLLDMVLPYRALILNIAEPGDTLRRMHQTCENPEFYWFLRNQGGRRWDGIFLSGGGNDVIDAAWDPEQQKSWILRQPANPGAITRDNVHEVIDQVAFAQLMDYLKLNILKIIDEGRDGPGGNSHHVPLFMHTYGLLQPRNSSAKLGPVTRGPWLYPACLWLGIDRSLWIEVARLILAGLSATLKSIVRPNFHVIDTLAETITLVPAAPESTGNSNDWENEIHPNRGGYRKLAATWSTCIAGVVP
jgi:hypothetical protein